MTYVLYHGSCWDGFGATWAALRGLSGQGHLEFIACNYNQPMPDIPDRQDVYIVDFSYPRKDLESLAARSRFLLVLDHHKTAQAELDGFPHAIFDMNHSGAVITWQYFFPSEPVPALLAYIEDRDLWRHQLPFSEAIHAWIASYPKTFESYTKMAEELQGQNLSSVVAEGNAILRFKNQKVDEICQLTRLQEWKPYGIIPSVNTSCFGSEIAHKLLETHPDSKFAAYYFTRVDGKVQWGLRSRKDFDCSEVAKQYGGGGHAQASGFEV